jgi:hypothetical protein
MNLPAIRFLRRYLACPLHMPLPEPETELDHLTVSVVMLAAAGDQTARLVISFVLFSYQRHCAAVRDWEQRLIEGGERN